jgi:hypothetical protein
MNLGRSESACIDLDNELVDAIVQVVQTTTSAS